LNLAGAAGVVQVSTNGFVRGGGSITSLQVQEAGAVEVAVGSTWTTGGTIDFATGSKVSVTGTLTAGNTYTLMTASAPITFATGSPTLVGATGWALRVDGANLLLLEVAKTTPTITANPTAAAIVYGQTLVSAELSNGSASVEGTFAFTSPSTAPAVGTSSQSVTFTPTDTTQYNTVQLNVNVTVSKANPATVFPTAATITYGQALSAATLTGGTGAGSYAFTSPTTIPNAGLTQNFEVTFTPSVPENYNTVTQMVSVAVNKATPTVSVAPTASAVTVGAQLSTSNLSGGMPSVAGTFAWTTPSTVVSATASYAVTFTPTDGANYNTASSTASVTANPAGTTFGSWSGNAVVTQDLVSRYAFGAADKNSAPQKLSSSITSTTLSVTAVVRTDDTHLVITPKSVNSLSGTWSATEAVISVVNAADQTGLGTGLVRKTYSLERGIASSRFLKLEAVYTP